MIEYTDIGTQAGPLNNKGRRTIFLKKTIYTINLSYSFIDI